MKICRNLMNNLLCLMLVFLAEATSQVPRPAQLPKEEKISGAPKYDKKVNIFNRFTLAIRKLEGYRVDQLGRRLLHPRPTADFGIRKANWTRSKAYTIQEPKFSATTSACAKPVRLKVNTRSSYEIKGIDSVKQSRKYWRRNQEDLGIKEEDQRTSVIYCPSAFRPQSLGTAL
ncbi:MAG: hypothetical protein R2824_28745 [Saprospiraceae bacterium]